jgi:hypothetical protein
MNKHFLLSALLLLSLTLIYQLFQNKEVSYDLSRLHLACGNISKEELRFLKLETEIRYTKLESKMALAFTHQKYILIILNFFAIIITLIVYGFALRKDFLLKKEVEIQALQTQINQQKELMDLKDEVILFMYENKSQ